MTDRTSTPSRANRIAVISDIHGNLEALEAVLTDIRTQQVEEIYCLGDVVGLGPNPCECIDLVMQHCTVSVLGEHDQAAMFDPYGFNPVALQAIHWTRDTLEAETTEEADGRWDFLGT